MRRYIAHGELRDNNVLAALQAVSINTFTLTAPGA
jgi:hypothetical protein